MALRRLEGRELTRTSADGVAFCRATLAAHRGDFDAASRELAESGPRAEASDHVARRTWFHRARSLVSLLDGDLARAYEEAIGAVDMDPSGMNTPLASREAARAAVWSRDPEKVRRAVAAMSGLPGRWIEAVRVTASAGLAALEGRREDALAGYARAIDAWRALDARLDLACCAIDMATVLPEEEATREVVAEARAFLEEIGAVPLLTRLDAVERSTSPAGAGSSA